MKPLTRQQQIENCKTFLKYWETVPKENIVRELGEWRAGKGKQSLHTCNTIACAGGWLPAIPEFAAMGVVADVDGAPILGGLSPIDLSDYLFGTWMFARNCHKHISDHEKVTHRFTQQIAELSK